MKVVLAVLLFSYITMMSVAKRRRIAKRNGVIDFRTSNNALDKSSPATRSAKVGGAFIWSENHVALGDTAVLHCSFDAIFSKLRDANISWEKEKVTSGTSKFDKIASGREIVMDDRRFKVYRPHAGALSVLLIRRVKKKDAGVYRCDLDGSKTKRKYMILNVTESKIDALTSPAHNRIRQGHSVDLWCNGTGYPRPMVYWSREGGRQLSGGRLQQWGNRLHLASVGFNDSGIYACYLENFVQPVVSYKFNIMVEDKPWKITARKMKFDGLVWYSYSNRKIQPKVDSSFLMMCKTKGHPIPLPHITWYKDGQEVYNSNDYFIIKDVNTWGKTYVSSTLALMNYKPQQSGNYTCVARNVYRHHRKIFRIHAYRNTEPSTSATVRFETTPTSPLTSADDLVTAPREATSNTAPSSSSVQQTTVGNTELEGHSDRKEGVQVDSV